MTIEQIDKSKVMILLGSEDMRDFSLEYDTLDFSDPHSRRILNRLLKLACSKTGLNTDNKRMYVEALPHNNGCLILLTLRPKSERRTYKIKRTNKELGCVFENCEALIQASVALGKNYIPKNSAYFYNGKYYLIIDSRPVSVYVLATFEEFSNILALNRITSARIKENGRLIAHKNAVGILSDCFK